MNSFLSVREAKEKLISELSTVTGFKYLKSGSLKKTVKDLIFEINFFSSKWNSPDSIEINAEVRILYKKFGKGSDVNNTIGFMTYRPDNFWYDITTERNLLETRDLLAQRFQETVLDLVHRFEEDETAAVRYLLSTGFEPYHVSLDFIADKLGQTAILEKAQQIYDELSEEQKEQVAQYKNGARNMSWMLHRCNLKYIVDNCLDQQKN